MSDFDIRGKVAVITGGAGGIGEVICRHFGEAGATVVVADMNEEKGAQIAQEISAAGGRAVFRNLDVTDSENVAAVFASAEEVFGTVDINVNCAGVTKRMDTLVFEEEAFDWIMKVNVKGTFLCAQAAARCMAKRKKGKIVNIASVGGLVGLKGTLGYTCSKGAVVQMTRTMALDLAEHNINVNSVAPALNRTAIAAPVINNPPVYKSFIDHIPLGRLCEPLDVANAIQFLCSPASDFITGQILPVDGGWTVD